MRITSMTPVPAFPCKVNVGMGYAQHPGMDLRDYFAAQALTGYLSRGTLSNIDDLATNAYKAADALLAKRGK